MKTVTPQMQNHLGQTTTTLAACWKITRTDGVVMGFTDHDQDIVYEGLTYVASTGFFRSAIANSATTAVDNLEVAGFLDADSIEETELRNGAYDYAEVEIFAINWADTSMGIIKLRYGLFGEVTIAPSGIFTVQLRGLTQLFSQVVGELYSAECRADLGDKRCKVVLQPDEHEESTNYNVGDRVIIPVDGLATRKRRILLPILNPNFENPPGGSVDGWNFTNAVLIQSDDADTGNYAVSPTTEFGAILQSLPHRNYLSSDEYNAYVNTNGTIKVKSSENGWQSRLTISYTNNSGTVVYATAASEWVDLVPGDYQIITAILNDRSVVEGPSFFSQSTRTRFNFEWRRTTGSSVVAPLLIDTASISVDGVTSYNLSNRNFDALIPSFNPPNWGGTLFALNVVSGTMNLSPRNGSYFLRMYSTETNARVSAEQFVNLPNDSSILAQIDDGNFEIEAGAYFGLSEWGAEMRFEFAFYTGPNGSGTLINSVEGDYEVIYPIGEWSQRSFKTGVPANARSVRVRIQAQRGAYANTLDASLDDVTVRILERGYEDNDPLAYGGVEYECISSGKSADTLPTVIPKTLGSSFTDGGTQWQVVAPRYTFLATITEVINNAVFEIDSPEKPDGWFEYGTVTLLDGPNRLRSIEVKNWVQSSKRVTLSLPFPYVPIVGQRLRIVTGCSRGRTVCSAKFANILNFRGEPDIPGTDQYFKVGTPG